MGHNKKVMEKYIYIRAWGILLGSFEYYIRQEQAKAFQENAPENAIYKDSEGVWHTFDTIQREDTKQRLTKIVNGL